jgi:HK97 gp10 family phage protein
MLELKVTGLDGVLDMLRKLPPEVVSKRGGPVKAALRKGALVIHKQAKANLLISTHTPGKTGKNWTTGLLAENLVVTRGKQPIGGKGERYLVRVRRKVYPNKSGRSHGQLATTTWQAARLLEYGSSQQAAEPWLRPAAAAKAQEAVDVTSQELVKRVNAIVKKLARK